MLDYFLINSINSPSKFTGNSKLLITDYLTNQYCLLKNSDFEKKYEYKEFINCNEIFHTTLFCLQLISVRELRSLIRNKVGEINQLIDQIFSFYRSYV